MCHEPIEQPTYLKDPTIGYKIFTVVNNNPAELHSFFPGARDVHYKEHRWNYNTGTPVPPKVPYDRIPYSTYPLGIACFFKHIDAQSLLKTLEEDIPDDVLTAFNSTSFTLRKVKVGKCLGVGFQYLALDPDEPHVNMFLTDKVKLVE